MGFEKVYITRQGSILAAKTLEGKKVEFDHAEIGSGTLNGDPRDRTSLITKVLQCNINNIIITAENQAQISFLFKNIDAPNSFYFREIGLYAIDPDTKEKVLYAYTNAGNTAEYITNSSTELIEKNIDITIVIDNTENINITLDPTQILVTERELNERAAEVTENFETQLSELKSIVVASNAGAHNGIYRGKDITNLFYNGTLSQQIASGRFDDIFIGDYIIGRVSKRKYLVAHLDYRLHCGDTECTNHHLLMIPEKIMGTAKMNDTNITTGAYVGSKMYTENLTPFKTVIQNDFETSHILKHRTWLPNAVTNGYESAGEWIDSTIELMNEMMVFGSNAFHNIMNGTNVPTGNVTIDNSQLSLFRLDKSKIVTRNDNNERYWYWLRDVVSASNFAHVSGNGNSTTANASGVNGVRPAFLIK